MTEDTYPDPEAARSALALQPGSGERMELMQTFVRIVDAGSLSAAAVQLGTTQPTISRRLQQLERALGLRLLQRTTHTMRLTQDGERCYERARELLAGWARFESELKGGTRRARRHLAHRGAARLRPGAVDPTIGPLPGPACRHAGRMAVT